MTFGRKVSLLIISLVACIGLLVSLIHTYMLNQRLDQVYYESAQLLGQALADSLAGQIINNESSQVLLVLNDLVKSHNEFEYAYVIDFNGRVFAHTFDKGFPAKLLSLSVNSRSLGAHINIDGREFNHYGIPIIEGMGASLHLGQSHDVQMAMMYELIIKMLMIIAAITSLGIFIAQGSARRIAGPIENIADQLINYIKGAAPSEIELTSGTHEIKRLVEAYNSLVRERHTIQSALNNSEARFEKLTRSSPVGVFQTDADGRCLYVNLAWCEITGLSLQEAQDEGWAAALHPDDRQRVYHEWLNAAQNNTKFESEYRFIGKQGAEIWVYGQANAEYDNQGKVIGYAGTITDITEQKQNSLVLQDERNFIDAVLDTANALVVVLDKQGRIIRFNRACEEASLYDSSEVMQQYIWDILLTEDEVESVKVVFQKLNATALSNEHTNYLLAKDKSRRLISWSNTVLTNNQGEVTHIISIGIDITEKQYVDGALHDALVLNEQIVNSSPFGIAIYDQTGQCVMANKAVAHMIGATQEQMLAQNYNHLNSWRTSGLLDAANEVTKRQQRRRHEFDVVTTFGTHAVYDCVFVPFDYQSQPHLLLMLDDVTLRNQIEKKLLLTSRAVDTAINAIAMAGLDTKLNYVNQSFLEMWGYQNQDEVVGRSAADFWRDQSAIDEMVVLLTEKGYWFGEMVGIKKDGQEFTASISANVTVDNNGQPISMMASFIDVSQQKAIEEELQRNQETLAKAQEIAHIGSWDWDILTGELKWSDEIYRIFGQDPRAFPASYDAFLGMIHSEDRLTVIDAMNASVENIDMPYSIEHRIVRPDRTHRTVHEQGIVYRDTKGKPIRMIGAVLDITDRKAAENQILLLNKELETRVAERTNELEESLKLLSKENDERKQAELSMLKAKDEAERANRLKSEFLGRMSHELRTPMNAILGFSQLLETENLGETPNDFVREISLAGNHLLGLINEVLDLSRIEAGRVDLELENYLLSDLVLDCINMVQPMAMEKNIRIDNRIDAAENLVLHVDQLRFKEVLVNLLGNAVKYNSQHGNIIVNGQMSTDQHIRLNVIDDGPGLTEEQQKLVFEPFNRLGAEYSDVEGTGIGLTIAKKLVTLMRGRIGVQSIVGQGSTFWVEYPLPEVGSKLQTQNDVQRRAAVTIKPLSQKTVLYVEDNQANLRLVQQLFMRLDNVVMYAAPNAELGIELARAKRPDLIMLDINLPGMDGYEALSRLRNLSQTCNTPVIAISAAAMPRDIERGLAAGFRHYIIKPIQVSELLEAVKKELGRLEQPLARG